MTTVVDGLDELKALAGQDLGLSDWVEISQDRVNTFADATGDHQWIHVDVERAKHSPFGGNIAHGYLTLALIVPMFHDLLEIRGTRMGINYGLDKVRFPEPVRVGSKIRLAGTVVSVDDAGGAGGAGGAGAGNGVQMVLDFTVLVEGQTKPACVARAVYRHYA